MRTCFALAATSLVVGLTGCMIVESPIRGSWGPRSSGATWRPREGPPRQWDEDGQGLRGVHPGLMARGDASVRAAKANGKITEVFSIDHSARNFFGIVGSGARW